jgi:hypothetical protein
MSCKRNNLEGFALVLTLVLLSLLVLAVLALGALRKVDTQTAATAVYQNAAKQNALLALDVALGDLQQTAFHDTAITGTADIVSNSRPENSRWTGVWFQGENHWLVSGSQSPSMLPVGASVVLVNSGSTNTANGKVLPGDIVTVPKVEISSPSNGGSTISGNFAFWVGDEGVKLSAGYNATFTPASPAAQNLGLAGACYPRKGTDGLTFDEAKVSRSLSYEQLVYAGDTSASASPAKLRSSFHGVTLTNLGYAFGAAPGRRALININSAGRRLWRGIWLTYNPNAPDSGSGSSDVLNSFATRMADQATIWIPDGGAKLPNGPFLSVDWFFLHTGVNDAISSIPNSDVSAFKAALEPWFTVRSDTFRIRAYGDALNPVPESGQAGGKIESKAYCEAIVQRIKHSSTAPGEGRFVITYFRWLGPDDI